MTSHDGMRTNRRKNWALGFAVVALVVVATVGGLIAGRSGLASAQPTSSPSYTPSRLVAGLAREAGVTDLRTLVSAGSGDNNTAIVTGTNAAGAVCWTAVAFGGAAAGPFRCGSGPSPETGALSVGYQTTGSAGSETAESVAVLGLVASDVASVEAELLDGSTETLVLTEGAFAYASSSGDTMPTSIRAYDDAGRLVAEKGIVLGSGLP